MSCALALWVLLVVVATRSTARDWEAGRPPLQWMASVTCHAAGWLYFIALIVRHMQGRGKPNEWHASPDGFLFINPTGLRRRTYIPREYIRDIRAESYFSLFIFREWRLCIELTTACVPLNFPPKRYTLWTGAGRSYVEAWEKILRQATNIRRTPQPA